MNDGRGVGVSVDLQHVFSQSMRRLAATVSVVTCASEGHRYGVTATAVTSLCAEPPSLLICLNAAASITQPLLREGIFCVNLLQSSQAEISKMFGGKVKSGERFHYGTWHRNSGGVPFLADAQANLFCRVDGAMPYGTHRIIIGRVEDGYFAPGVSPLLYQNGAYVSASLLAA
jgi:flavin reductase